MGKSILKVVVTLALGLFLCGCQTTQHMGVEYFDKDWGHSYKAARYNQVLHPEAGGTKAVLGLDGEASEKIYQQYRESFSGEQSEMPTVLED